MAENPKNIGKNEETPKTPNNLFSFFPKFELRFPFPFPFPWQDAKPDGMKAVDMVVDEGEKSITQKPDTVRFPKTDLIVVPLETESDYVPGKTSNPAVLWQVYALGGFLVLSWAWTRWKERRSRKRDDRGDDGDDDDVEDEEKDSSDI